MMRQAGAAVPPNYLGCPRRRGGPVRDKARSLPAQTSTALAAAIGLLGAGAGFGISALIPASGHDPGAGARPAAVGPASALPGSSQLTSATLPLAAAQRGAGTPAVSPLHGL